MKQSWQSVFGEDTIRGHVMSQADIAKSMGKSLRSVVRWEASAMKKLRNNPDAAFLYEAFEHIRKYGEVGEDYYA